MINLDGKSQSDVLADKSKTLTSVVDKFCEEMEELKKHCRMVIFKNWSSFNDQFRY